MSTPAAATASAVVNLDLPGATISRHLYGHFAEHLGRCIYDGFYVGEDSPIPNEGGIRLDVVEALRALDIPNLRWPGGCFADEYHWQDGVGPKQDRPAMVNTHWGNVEENNHFGTHEFMALCELLGADPYISGNVGSGSVREMGDWVEYLTRDGDSPMVRARKENGRELPWKVPYWGLGNETWGCGGNMRADYYAELARQFATYCRDHDGNTLYKIASGAQDGDFHWTEALMKSLGDLGGEKLRRRQAYQAVSFHYYTITGPTWNSKGSATDFTEAEYYQTMVKARRMDEIVAGHARVMDAYDPDGKLGLVCDEWGTWWQVEPGTNPGFLYQQNTLRDALVASLHFDIFHKHARRLVMANIAQTVNVLQAMVLTDGEKLVLTPTYHVFEMNRGHHDAGALDVRFTAEGPRRAVDDRELDTLSVSASAKDGRALFSLSNLDADAPVRVRIELRGGALTAPEARVLTADTVSAHNTADRPETVAPVKFDGYAVENGVLTVDLPPASFVTVAGAIG